MSKNFVLISVLMFQDNVLELKFHFTRVSVAILLSTKEMSSGIGWSSNHTQINITIKLGDIVI